LYILIKSHEIVEVPRKIELKNLYNKVKGQINHKSGDDNDGTQQKNINDLLNKIKILGEIVNKPENYMKYKKVAGKDLDDDKSPIYYYKSKFGVHKSDQHDNYKGRSSSSTTMCGKIKSIIIKGDIDNKLNPGKYIRDIFDNNKVKEKVTPTYYYCKVFGEGMNNPENIQLILAKGDTNMDEVYNKIKILGGISNNPNDDESLHLIKVYGKADINEIGKHIKQAEKVANKSAPKDMPKAYYFQNKLFGKNIVKTLGTELLGKVDSITIIKPLLSENNFGKDIETLFKEGEDEDEKKIDYGTNPTYFMTKIKAGIIPKPKDLDLIPVNGTNKIENIYKSLELKDDELIQLFKLSGFVDKKHLLDHAIEAGECYNTQREPGISEESQNCYYTTTEIEGDNTWSQK